MQIIGRACRHFPGKKNALILDIVDNIGSQSIQTIGDAFGVRGCNFLKEDVFEKAKVVKKAMELGIEVDVTDTIDTIEKKTNLIENVIKGTVYVKTTAEVRDVFAAAGTVMEVKKDSEFPWIKLNNEHYVLPMMDGKMVDLNRNPLGIWTCRHDGINFTSDTKKPLKWADGRVKTFYDKYDWKAKSMRAAWRQAPASFKQRETLKRFGIIGQPQSLSKGEAASLLDYLIWHRKVARLNAAKGEV
jgi:hypothetical protein